ncbi:MAG TPA: hypothetical protein VN868_05370, partial [Terriglobales bacterium]|nr:hypothetical protein [Terriglobales bacterium]
MTSKHPWWMACTVGGVLLYAVGSLRIPAGFALTAFGDLSQFLVLCAASVAMVANAVSSRGQARLFWGLFAAGCTLWAA